MSQQPIEGLLTYWWPHFHLCENWRMVIQTVVAMTYSPTLVYIDHVEKESTKIQITQKIGVKRRNSYQKNEEVWRMKGTNKLKYHRETYLIRFDSHGDLCQSEENKCMWTHSKNSATGHTHTKLQIILLMIKLTLFFILQCIFYNVCKITAHWWQFRMTKKLY